MKTANACSEFKSKCHFAANKYTWIFGRIDILPDRVSANKTITWDHISDLFLMFCIAGYFDIASYFIATNTMKQS